MMAPETKVVTPLGKAAIMTLGTLFLFLITPLRPVGAEILYAETAPMSFEVWAADLAPGFFLQEQTINDRLCYCKKPGSTGSSTAPFSFSFNTPNPLTSSGVPGSSFEFVFLTPGDQMQPTYKPPQNDTATTRKGTSTTPEATTSPQETTTTTTTTPADNNKHETVTTTTSTKPQETTTGAARTTTPVPTTTPKPSTTTTTPSPTTTPKPSTTTTTPSPTTTPKPSTTTTTPSPTTTPKPSTTTTTPSPTTTPKPSTTTTTPLPTTTPKPTTTTTTPLPTTTPKPTTTTTTTTPKPTTTTTTTTPKPTTTTTKPASTTTTTTPKPTTTTTKPASTTTTTTPKPTTTTPKTTTKAAGLCGQCNAEYTIGNTNFMDIIEWKSAGWDQGKNYPDGCTCTLKVHVRLSQWGYFVYDFAAGSNIKAVNNCAFDRMEVNLNGNKDIWCDANMSKYSGGEYTYGVPQDYTFTFISDAADGNQVAAGFSLTIQAYNFGRHL